jgi:hypothetical protein
MLIRKFRYFATVTRDLLKNAFFYRHLGIRSTTSFLQIKIKGYKNTFFGYYDTSPFNPEDCNKLLIHANNANVYLNPDSNKTDIYVYDTATKTSLKIGETFAWNWQQGARLSWIDKSTAIFNIYDKTAKKYRATTVDVNTGKIQTYDFPVQSVFKNKFYLSFSYDPLNLIRPDYGYRCYQPKPNCYKENKIMKIDLTTLECEILIDINDLHNQIVPDNSTVLESKAKFNHILINSNGTSFIFLYRYFLNGKRLHVLCMYDFNSETVINILENQVVSHYCWLDNQTILFWGVVGGISGYYSLDVNDPKPKLEIDGVGDGHPSFVSKNQILTDSYPDKSGLRNINFMNLSTGKFEKIASVYQSPWFRAETRCDPHPSISADKKRIQIDSVSHRGRRVAIFEL